MKSTGSLPHTSFLLIVTMTLCLAFSSCYKEPFYKCEIYVTDTLNVPIPGATVDLIPDVTPPPQVFASGITDEHGLVSFDFSNEAVFNVTATKGGSSGNGFVKLENRQTVKETVIIP